MDGTPLNSTELNFPLTAAPGKSVEIILENQDILFPHPIHIHGHTFFVLGSGKGAWDEKYRSKLNLKNPMRRDTVHMDNPGWVVLRIVVDNPGIWLAHCHKQWHVEMGLAWTFSEMLGKMKKLKAPAGWKELCA